LFVESTDNTLILPYDFGQGEYSPHDDKHVQWIDNDDAIYRACQGFVEHMKLFVQKTINHEHDTIHWRYCQFFLNELRTLVDCSDLEHAFGRTRELAVRFDRIQILHQQTLIAQLISRILSFSC
jgi:hypothetical protein